MKCRRADRELFELCQSVKNSITCQHVITKKIHTFHADRVTPFIVTTQDADKVGLLDREEFEVNSILHHEEKKKSALEAKGFVLSLKIKVSREERRREARNEAR
jgi:hypothetical protein